MRGRKPKPTNLKVIMGNPGKRPLNAAEPVPKLAVPPCPDHLSELAKEEWDRISAELISLGLLTEIDRAALACYCQAWGRWQEAEQALKRHGIMVRSPAGFPMQSPYLAVANRAIDQMHKFLVEFGMTPSARTRVSAMTPRTSDNPWDSI